ncbi:MAG: adenylate/guanylate cyclase domain-containing protein [Betaproteobacteria bacterium]|nr:adenylate/guanylate cyclase domain-containing protein [Betaproteobacteria bacterium]
MPPMQAGTRRRVAFFRRALGIWVVIGTATAVTSGSAFRDASPLEAIFDALAAVINVVIVAGAIGGAEIFLPRTRLGQALERAPFLLTFAIKLLVYGIVIVLVFGGGSVGERFAAAAADVLLGPAHPTTLYIQTMTPTASLLARAFFFLGLAIFLFQLSRLIGERALRDILFGRYHRSRSEERFFLFVDIAGSTPLAERIGPEAIHRFLREVFRLASDPIDDHGGEVYQHVGDEVVITWTLAEGHAAARPVACYFAIESALKLAAKDFEREFGTVPRLRAALHAGPVITGEVGGSRRSIVFHGDVMNTTSRIENATRELDRSFLISEDALNRLQGIEAYTFADLGPRQLRGREAFLRLYAVGPGMDTPDPAARQ